MPSPTSPDATLVKEELADLEHLDGLKILINVVVQLPDGGAVVAAAKSQLGVPYVWGAESPGHAFDCSGLTQWCYAQAGIAIPRTAATQHAFCQARHVSVPVGNLLPGDLVFFVYGRLGGTVDHVAISVGGSRIIQAPHTGAVVSYGTINSACIGGGRPG